MAKRQKPDPHFGHLGPRYDINTSFGGMENKYSRISLPEGIEMLKGDIGDLAKKYWESTQKEENQVFKLPPLPSSWVTGILRALRPIKGLYEAEKKSPLKVSGFTTLVGGKSRRDLLLNLIGKKKKWTKDQLDYLRRLDDARLNLGTKLDDFIAKFYKSMDDGTPMPKMPKFKGIEDSAKNILKKAIEKKTTFHAEGGIAGMLGERTGYDRGGRIGFEEGGWDDRVSSAAEDFHSTDTAADFADLGRGGGGQDHNWSNDIGTVGTNKYIPPTEDERTVFPTRTIGQTVADANRYIQKRGNKWVTDRQTKDIKERIAFLEQEKDKNSLEELNSLRDKQKILGGLSGNETRDELIDLLGPKGIVSDVNDPRHPAYDPLRNDDSGEEWRLRQQAPVGSTPIKEEVASNGLGEGHFLVPLDYVQGGVRAAEGGRIGYQDGARVDPRMNLSQEENIRRNKIQRQMNERVRSQQGTSASGHGLGGLELRNRFIPSASGEMSQFSGYGIKPQAYNLNNPSMTPSYNQIYASYRNQGLSPERIKAMAYADTRQSGYGDRGPLPMAGDPYDPLSLDKHFTTPKDMFANYQEGLRRSMMGGQSDIYWDPERRYPLEGGQGGMSDKGIYTFRDPEPRRGMIIDGKEYFANYQEGLRRSMLEGSPEVYWDQGPREYKLHDSEYLRNLYNQPSEFEQLSGYKTEKEAIDAMGIEAYNRVMAKGGRVAAQEGGLMNLGGMEKDYRQEGGFVPIGGEEKADDVPARLSKNEFVFTADAVRAAGGGDIDQGAEVMEKVMENLEAGGKVSEESQGLEGARSMFANAQQLEKRII